jgi:hypothetical protein
MRRTLLIFLSLVLALVGWSTVCADDGFYVIPAMKGKYAPVPKTGQTTSFDQNQKDDGALQKGVAWPTPRFTDNNNGTVTDKLTGLIWMKNANYFIAKTWTQALSDCNGLASGSDGLIDGSQAGDWRLPNLKELLSLIDYGRSYPALPEGHPFSWDPAPYWSSTTSATSTANAWTVGFADGDVGSSAKSGNCWVWPVRGGK